MMKMGDQYVLDRMTVLLSVALIVVLVAGATYVFTSNAQPAGQNATANLTEIPKISVSGEATRTVSPDLLIMGIAVETENETASGAESANARMTAKVKSALLAAGVQESEIETASYYTYPVYNDSCYYYPPPCRGDICPMTAEEGYAGEGAYADSGVAYTEDSMIAPEIYPVPPSYRCDQQIIGYRATHSIMVKTSNIYNGGEIIDSISAANASARFDYQYYSLKDETRIRYENELAGAAAQSARSKAQSIASGLGAQLGRIVDIQTNYYYPPYYGMKDYSMAEGGMAISASAEPIATEIFPQDLTISSSIYVTFEITQ
ncbi:SIMPL domain-containing protein [Candidatus Micrarchaeota archaeon]|nr:SIMPL domain-containing protein [Candidatus Micrarchaeota archaeon]